jgi:hypothetical protein
MSIDAFPNDETKEMLTQYFTKTDDNDDTALSVMKRWDNLAKLTKGTKQQITL